LTALVLRPHARRMRVRWSVFMFLLLFGVVAYVQRTAISVAAEPMMPELGLSQLQIGWLETGFLVTYTIFQFPGGLLGQAMGARRMLTACGGVAVLAAIAFPLLPWVAREGALFALLLLAQLVLGAGQAPLFAMVSGTLERWFPSRQWALTQGLTTSGVGLGAAIAPALIASLMVVTGWRQAMLIAAVPGAVLVALWWQHGRDTPAEHPGVTTRELEELDTPLRRLPVARTNWHQASRLLVNPHIAGLTLAYFGMNVVFYLITFWSFLYLVQARHFTVLAGGFAAAAPPLAGAAGAALGGFAGTFLCGRIGARWGLRIVPLVALPAAALLLLGVQATSAGAALLALSLAFGLVEMTEASFWTASMQIGSASATAAGGILNTGGNLGGIVATPLVAAMSGGGDWSGPFVLAGVCALGSAVLWLAIDPSRRSVEE
jgi:MFS transporter, ACS family, glucarate transporter